MPSKIFIIFIVLLSNIIFLNCYSDEQISFDVSEIEIIDGGNKIIGKNRGIISTNNGLKINADKFEFDKIKNILKAEGNIKIIDKLNNFDVVGEKVSYDKEKELIEISGESFSTIDSNYNFKTEDIIILRNEMIIRSDKSAKITDIKNKIRFEINKFSYSIKDKIIKGEDIFINREYDQPFSEKYFFESATLNLLDQSYIAKNINIDLKKDIFGNNKNDPRFKGSSSSSKNGITTINKATFTSCKKNDKCPPWAIQADKVTYDENQKQILYDNAIVKIYDVPVIYFPKFFHPDPTVKRQSGFLVPRINNSNILGSSLQVPYFQVLAENKDFTFKPTFFDKNIFMFQSEYRQQNENSFFISDLNITDGYKSKKSNESNTLTHFFQNII